MTIKPLRNEPFIDRLLWYFFTVLILTSLTYFGAHFIVYLVGGY